MITGIFSLNTKKIQATPEPRKHRRKKRRVIQDDKDKDEKIQLEQQICKLCERHIPVIFY